MVLIEEAAVMHAQDARLVEIGSIVAVQLDTIAGVADNQSKIIGMNMIRAGETVQADLYQADLVAVGI